MKKILRLLVATCLFFFTTSLGIAQNLVPNPSFEEYTTCPWENNQVFLCTGWNSFGNSPDYFNACAPFGINVPNSMFGFQHAHKGSGMIGLCTYRDPNKPDGPNYRELIGVQLLNSLQNGSKYFISFYTNFAYGPSVAVASNKIGCRFANIEYSEFNIAPINNHAVLYSNSIITDSTSWVKITGSFIADSA
ncbi:MAG: hypothetical protein WCL06_05845, partial [Bacteroidota bacterium]